MQIKRWHLSSSTQYSTVLDESKSSLLCTFWYCVDNFYPWKDIVGKKVSKLRFIAELSAFYGILVSIKRVESTSIPPPPTPRPVLIKVTLSEIWCLSRCGAPAAGGQAGLQDWHQSHQGNAFAVHSQFMQNAVCSMKYALWNSSMRQNMQNRLQQFDIFWEIKCLDLDMDAKFDSKNSW
jgi:hypothetical protein